MYLAMDSSSITLASVSLIGLSFVNLIFLEADMTQILIEGYITV
jgi:hypothetical protein